MGPKTQQEFDEALAQIRAAAHKRRAEAWAMVPETVLGLELVPLTPAIYSILLGTGNAYVTGKVPTEADLRNFVWFCSPYFNPDKPQSGRWLRKYQMWRLDIALRKGATMTRFSPAVLENFYRACLQIHEIIHFTFKDCAMGREGGETLAASMEAQIVDMFAREYKMWPLPKTIRHTPIKQLYQLARCMDRRALGKEDAYYDADENKLTETFLTNLNPKT